MPAVGRRNPGVRIIAGSAVFAAHVYVVVWLLSQRAPTVTSGWYDTELLVIIDLPPADTPPLPAAVEIAVPRSRTAISLEPPAIELPAAGARNTPQDWWGAVERAAVKTASTSQDAPRNLGTIAQPQPKRREAKPFGWDTSQTERVEALPGAIRLRLGNRCEVVFAPFPVGGCALGKIPARGDLFSEMSAPVEPDDWRDDTTILNGR